MDLLPSCVGKKTRFDGSQQTTSKLPHCLSLLQHALAHAASTGHVKVGLLVCMTFSQIDEG